MKYEIGAGELRERIFFFVKIFQDTPLRPPSYVLLDSLEQGLRYNIKGFKLPIFYWEPNETGGESSKRSDLSLTVADLLKECPEIRAFAKEFYPHHVL